MPKKNVLIWLMALVWVMACLPTAASPDFAPTAAPSAINTFIALMGFLFLGLLLTFTIVDIDNRTDREPAGLKSVKPAVAAPAVGGAAPAAASAPAEAKPAAH